MEVTPVSYGWMLEEVRAQGAVAGRSGDAEAVSAVLQRAPNAWMVRLAAGDLSGPVFPVAQYLQLRDMRVEGNPRQTQEYREGCLQAVGLGAEVDMTRYGHL